jgi:hypothetical protein
MAACERRAMTARLSWPVSTVAPVEPVASDLALRDQRYQPLTEFLRKARHNYLMERLRL